VSDPTRRFCPNTSTQWDGSFWRHVLGLVQWHSGTMVRIDFAAMSSAGRPTGLNRVAPSSSGDYCWETMERCTPLKHTYSQNALFAIFHKALSSMFIHCRHQPTAAKLIMLQKPQNKESKLLSLLL